MEWYYGGGEGGEELFSGLNFVIEVCLDECIKTVNPCDLNLIDYMFYMMGTKG